MRIIHVFLGFFLGLTSSLTSTLTARLPLLPERNIKKSSC